MDLLGLLPDSFRVATPSGGRHVYMRVPPDFAYTVAAEQVIAGIRLSPLPDFPGVDVRCNGGYVVGPGSVTKEGAYVAL